MDAVLLKWESTGLLEGLDSSEKPDAARMLESVSLELFERTVTAGEILKIGESNVANLIFPVARRLWDRGLTFIIPRGYSSISWNGSKRNPPPSTLDEEVEACHQYTEQVVHELFNEGKHTSWAQIGKPATPKE